MYLVWEFKFRGRNNLLKFVREHPSKLRRLEKKLLRVGEE